MESDLKDLVIDMADRLQGMIQGYREHQVVPNYMDMADCTTLLLDETFGKDKYTLPIDIEQIMRNLGIEVIELELNDKDKNGFRFNRIVGELSISPQFFEDNVEKCIYIDSETTLFTQRYALAHELGHYLINKNKKLYNDEYCIMPMLPKQAEELIADAFAVSLLIPIKAFIKQFNVYLNEEKESGNLPISTEYWLQYLSTSARVSYHYVACGYQQLRSVALWLYQYRINKKHVEIIDNIVEKEILLEKLNEQKLKYPNLIEDIDEFLTDDIITQLYQ